MRRELLDAAGFTAIRAVIVGRAVDAGRRLDVISTLGFRYLRMSCKRLRADALAIQAYETAIGRWRLVDQWFKR